MSDAMAFTRVAACALAQSPIRDPHSEGFSHFVASSGFYCDAQHCSRPTIC